MSTSTNSSEIVINDNNPFVTILKGVTTAITGASITLGPIPSDSVQTCQVYVSDQYGLLSTTKTPGVTNTINFYGTLDQVNLDLAALTDTSNVPGMDTINITAMYTSYTNPPTATSQIQVTVTHSSQPTVSTSSTTAVAQGSTTTVSTVSISAPSTTSGPITTSGLADGVTGPSSSSIFTVTVTDNFGTLSDAPIGAVTLSGITSHSITVTGNLVDVNATLAALQYTATTIGADVLTVHASVAGTSAPSVGTQIINVGAVNTSIANTPTNQAVDLLYQALLNRLPDAGGLAFWASTNASISQIASAFVQSSEFTSTHGPSLPNAFFVQELYQSVLGRAADTGGAAFWVNQLNSGASQAAVLVGIATSAESQSVNASHFNHGFLVS